MPDQTKQPPAIVWWVIWASMLIGVFVIYFTTSTGVVETSRTPTESPLWMVAFAPFVISSILRWLVLSRVSSAQLAFPLFIAGMALAEATCLTGLFVFPRHSTDLFALSVLGIAQYVPYFASRFTESE